MASVRSDSLLAKRIVQSFLRFLDSVELVPNVDSEAIIVANQCLADAFQVNVSTSNEATQPDLISLFRQAGYDATVEVSENIGREYAPQLSPTSDEAITDKSSLNYGGTDLSDANLFEQFKDVLMNVGYFDERIMAYHEHLEKAKTTFAAVLKKVRDKGDASDQHILAEAFKAQGNDSMAKSHFVEAIGLYTMAIKLSPENAVYYSNRAAAYTQVGDYEAAIGDSNEAIRLDPNYSKAYSRLGLAYYTQGKYKEAIEKGFQIARSLDPNNKSILENLQAAQRKMNEESSRGSNPNEEQRQPHATNQGPETRFSTNIGLAELGSTITSFTLQLSGGQMNESENGNVGVNMERLNPEVMTDGNLNIPVVVDGEQAFAGMMQRVMQMISRSNGQVNSDSQNDTPSQGN